MCLCDDRHTWSTKSGTQAGELAKLFWGSSGAVRHPGRIGRAEQYVVPGRGPAGNREVPPGWGNPTLGRDGRQSAGFGTYNRLGQNGYFVPEVDIGGSCDEPMMWPITM